MEAAGKGRGAFLRPPQFSSGQKSEKCIERAESLTETLATQATCLWVPLSLRSLTNCFEILRFLYVQCKVCFLEFHL